MFVFLSSNEEPEQFSLKRTTISPMVKKNNKLRTEDTLPSETNFFISDYKSLDKKCKFKGQAKNIYLFVSRTYGTISVFVLTSFSG